MFRDRADAGRELAEELKQRLGEEDVVVLGLPRGGVPVAFEVARELDAPLDVIVVRKLGVPYQPELGMGAIGEDGVRVLNDQVLAMARVGEDEVAAVERSERAELERRATRFRGSRPRASLVGRTAVVVDDGIATGSTARAACQVARAHGASRVILAVPVAPRSSLGLLAEVADALVCLATPEPFYAVGQFYRDFSQTSDEEVVEFLERAPTRTAAPPVAVSADPPVRDEDVVVQTGVVRLVGHLTIPEKCAGLVVFAHGSGSSRHSPRNRFVAAVLNSAGLGTLLFDLLTPDEEFDRAAVFDIELLAERLGVVTQWLEAQPEAEGLRIGYFGASTGAGAALWAAAKPNSSIAAVVSGEDVLTSPVRSLTRCERRRCSSWVATTRSCSSSTVRRRCNCVVRASWRWCPAPPISLRSLEPWRRCLAWRVTGSFPTWRPLRRRLVEGTVPSVS